MSQASNALTNAMKATHAKIVDNCCKHDDEDNFATNVEDSSNWKSCKTIHCNKAVEHFVVEHSRDGKGAEVPEQLVESLGHHTPKTVIGGKNSGL